MSVPSYLSWFVENIRDSRVTSVKVQTTAAPVILEAEWLCRTYDLDIRAVAVSGTDCMAGLNG